MSTENRTLVVQQALVAIEDFGKPISLEQVYGKCTDAVEKSEVAVAINELIKKGSIIVVRPDPGGPRLFVPAGSLLAAELNDSKEERQEAAGAPTSRGRKPAKTSVASLVKTCLKEADEEMTSQQIAEATGLTDQRHAISVALATLVRSGQVTNRPSGDGVKKLFSWWGKFHAFDKPAGPSTAAVVERPKPVAGQDAMPLRFCKWSDGTLEIYRGQRCVFQLNPQEAFQLVSFVADRVIQEKGGQQ